LDGKGRLEIIADANGDGRLDLLADGVWFLRNAEGRFVRSDALKIAPRMSSWLLYCMTPQTPA
jgi:hypothetical protein